MHDPTKVLMGAGLSSAKDILNFDADPATFLAGLAVRRKTSGVLGVALADGVWAGISLGRSLSDHKKTAVAICGEKIPVLLELAPARQVVTITSYANLIATANDTLKIGATTFTFKGSVSTEAEVLASVNNDTTAAALVAKINAHSVAGLLFKAVAVANVVTITAKNNATLGSSIDCVYVDVHGSSIGLTVADDAILFVGGGETPDYVVVGAKVYFSDTSGKADDPASGATVSDAIYMSGVLSGVDESGNTVAAVLVDMTGGL